MKKRLNKQEIRCKECKHVIDPVLGLPVVEILRDHWSSFHLEKLLEIDKWLGKHDDEAKIWEKVVNVQEGKENESK